MPIDDFLNLAGVLLATLALLCGLLIILMARTLLRPTRMTDARANWILKRLTPRDLDLDYENLTFVVRDEQTGRKLRLAGWWIPSPAARRTILLIHGYADAKVGGIAWAPMLHSLGWNLLAIDLRAHGESEGAYSTAGFWERHDVTQMINQFRATRPEQEALAIFGVSLGAAVAIATAVTRDDIAALIMESPFADYRRAIAAHGRMRALPGGWMREAAIRVAEWIGGADFRAVRPEALIAQVKCPALLVHAGNDPFVPDDDAEAMTAALVTRNNPLDARWSIAGAGHVLGLAAGPDEYRNRVAEFLESALRARPVSSS